MVPRVGQNDSGISVSGSTCHSGTTPLQSPHPIRTIRGHQRGRGRRCAFRGDSIDAPKLDCVEAFGHNARLQLVGCAFRCTVTSIQDSAEILGAHFGALAAATVGSDWSSRTVDFLQSVANLSARHRMAGRSSTNRRSSGWHSSDTNAAATGGEPSKGCTCALIKHRRPRTSNICRAIPSLTARCWCLGT